MRGGQQVILRLRFALSTGADGEVVARHSGAVPADTDTDTEAEAEAEAEAVARRLEPGVAAAAPAPGDSLSHASLPGGGALLCHVPAAAAEEQPPAEVLFLPNGAAVDLPALWPVDLWRSPTWQPQRTGPAVPRPGAAITDEQLAAFARERHREERLVPFLSDVRRLFAVPGGPRLVLAEEDQATVALWIALACRFLHRFEDGTHARSLTFSTRAPHPERAPQQLLGIGPDSDFDRKDPELLARYRVHDGLGGQGSEPDTDPWVAQAARLWLAELPGPADPPAPAGPPAPAAPAPPPEQTAERLRLAARQLRGRPHELRGLPLYRMLAGRLPEGDPADADTLRLLYELVWGTGDPDLHGALELLTSCPPALLTEARLRHRVTAWLTRPGEITADRCQLARELLPHQDEFELDPAQRAAVGVLVAGQDIAADGETAAAAGAYLRARLNQPQARLSGDLLAWARRRLRRHETGAGLP